MKRLAEKVTDYIVRVGAISEETYAIYQYGIQIGLEMLGCFLVCLGISLYLHMFPQFLVFTTIFILLRTYAGGLHLNCYLGCLICSVSVQTFVLLINEHYTVILPVAWMAILIGSIGILTNAPVENINRELDKEEKNHCKKITTRVLLGIIIFTCGCTAFRMNKIVSLISLTMLIVLISQYIGILKYNVENKKRK